MSEKEITVREVLQDYYEDAELRGYRSQKSRRSEIKILNEHIGDLTADAITFPLLLQFQRERLKDYAPATVNKMLAVLRVAFRIAAENERITTGPARWPRKLRPAKPRQGFLEFEDYLAVREQLPEWGKPVIDFGLYSGWRKQEVLGLTWSEVDLDAKQIRLDPERSKNHEGRLLPLAEFGLEVILRQHKRRVPGVDFVFLRKGGRITSTYWHYTWEEATDKAGRGHLLFHDLRRTCVRNLERGGVPRGIAMKWIGHRTEEMYRRYNILNERDMANAAERYAGAVFGGKRRKVRS